MNNKQINDFYNRLIEEIDNEGHYKEKRLWNFASLDKWELNVYEFNTEKCLIWISVKEFDDKWCFFICYPSNNKYLSPIFEFNIFKEYNSYSNFKLFFDDDFILARCYGLFNMGKKFKNSHEKISRGERFINYINHNISDIRIDSDEKGKFFAEVFKLNKSNIDINEFLNKITTFAMVVSQYKTDKSL